MAIPNDMAPNEEMELTQRAPGRPSNGSPSGTDSSQRPDDIESGRPAEPLTRNDAELKLDETLLSFFSKGVPVVDVILVVSFFVKMRHNKLSGCTAIVYLTSFFLSFCMHVVGMSSSQCIKPVKWRGMMAYLSTVLRMLSAASLLLFLDYGIHSVAVLPPFVLVLSLVAYLSRRTFGSITLREELGLNWGPFTEELKLRFDMSAKVVSMAFTGLAGRVLGGYAGVAIHNHKQARSRGFMAVAPECFLFYGLVLGLLLVLHCTVPSHVNRLTRERLAKVYKPLVAYVALLLLILASVVAAEDMLRMNVFFVCFGIVVAVVVYFFWRNHRGGNAIQRVHDEDQQRQQQPAGGRPARANAWREQDANFSQYLLTGYFTPLFSLVMAIHSKYSIIIDGASSSTMSLSLLFKFFLFCGLCSILIYAVRIVVFAEMRDGDRDGWAISSTTYVTYGTMAFTGVSFVLVLALKFGELKNILS